ncbi:MAG: ABC transporter ATP-binding protein [Oscillibacter sp.]|nr:ABC transporter ATP-binding protein [Oscillibacter sp.]
MPVSKAHIKATNKWMAKAYDRVNLTMPKGKKEIIQAHAEARGESVNGFINRAISEAMERDQAAQGPPDGPPQEELEAAP